MYSNKMVCCLKANGKVLREFKDTVYVPFGTEYSILIKNLNSVRAAVNISVDGTDATENVSLIVDANREVELTRFIKNGNLNTGNRFKFIERTDSIEQFRGVGVEDGLIRIQFQFEQRFSKQPITPISWCDQERGTFYSADVYMKGGIRGSTLSGIASGEGVGKSLRSMSANTTTSQAAYSSTVVNDAGITVPGSVSNQQFSMTSGFVKDPEVHVMVLKLLGETPHGQVVEPVTVKTKTTCTTCGRVNKATSKFCSNCGTSLQIV